MLPDRVMPFFRRKEGVMSELRKDKIRARIRMNMAG